ncbi:MAG: hypothetical protein AAF658_04680 [Myxococcota bacterium]
MTDSVRHTTTVRQALLALGENAPPVKADLPEKPAGREDGISTRPPELSVPEHGAAATRVDELFAQNAGQAGASAALEGIHGTFFDSVVHRARTMAGEQGMSDPTETIEGSNDANARGLLDAIRSASGEKIDSGKSFLSASVTQVAKGVFDLATAIRDGGDTFQTRINVHESLELSAKLLGTSQKED